MTSSMATGATLNESSATADSSEASARNRDSLEGSESPDEPDTESTGRVQIIAIDGKTSAKEVAAKLRDIMSKNPDDKTEPKSLLDEVSTPFLSATLCLTYLIHRLLLSSCLLLLRAFEGNPITFRVYNVQIII